MIEFLAPGLLTTVQDFGRHNYQRYGMPHGGAMDSYALAIANILCGNDRHEAGLECTVLGPTICFGRENLFAISGGDFAPTLSGRPIVNNRLYLGRAGDILRLGAAKTGCRAYITFAGGLDADMVMGSKSTYLKGRIGGLHGRAVQKGDRLGFTAPVSDLPNLEYRYVEPNFGMRYTSHPTVRVLLGPQEDYFTPAALDAFFSGAYTVTKENDRMGCRLSGPALSFREGKNGNIVSDGICFGAIQVPSDQPIIMMADHQTTGGYAKLGSVIWCDLPLIAQLKTGDTLRFKRIGIEEAQQVYLAHRGRQLDLMRHLNVDVIRSRREMEFQIEGKTYSVMVEEL